MASVKSFYGKRTKHCFLSDAVSQIENDDSDSADVVMIVAPKYFLNMIKTKKHKQFFFNLLH